MKILLVTPHFPPRRIGGVEIYTKRLADHLRESGDSPEVMCVERIDAGLPGVEVIRDTAYGYPVHRLSFSLSSESDTFTATYRSSAVEEWTYRLIDEIRPDVVHVHSGYLLGGAVMRAARHRNVPAIVTLHDYWFICARINLLNANGGLCSGPDSPAKCAWCLATAKRRFRVPDMATGGRLGHAVIKALEYPTVASATGWSASIRAVIDRADALRDTLVHANLVFAPSKFLRDLIVQTGLIPASRIVISRLGIHVPRTRSANPAGRSGLLRIGYLGQLAPHKGVGILIEALRSLPGAPLNVHIYGDPHANQPYADELTRMAAGDPRISFRGAYPHEQVYQILSEVDAIVVPSICYEVSPLVVQEAQAARVPVIGSRRGGIPELVRDEHDGLLFEPGNSRDLARQLHRLLVDPALRDRLRPDGTSVRTDEDEMRGLLADYQRLSQRRLDPTGTRL
jgi:glycosyltransferase involved in cell wall biosynthesis